MNEALQPKQLKDHSLMRWIITCGIMLLIVALFGTFPMLISYRKIMGA
jgi:hypothetical protein